MLFEACHMNYTQIRCFGITFRESRGIVEDTETVRPETHRSDENTSTEICRIAFAQTGPNIIDTGSEAIT
jgi:hypothetical protein